MENFNQLPEKDQATPFDLTTINFSQAVFGHKLYFGTSETILGKDGTSEQRFSLISSTRDKIACSPPELSEAGLGLRRSPVTGITPRWSLPSRRTFLTGEEGSLSESYLSVRSILVNHVSLSEESWYDIVTLWIIGTYLYQGFAAYPYLQVNGAKGSGKSRLLEVLAALSFNGLLTASATPAFIFRYIDTCQATLCIDEAEQLKLRKGNEDAQMLISVLNQGYRQGATISRCVVGGKKGDWATESYLAYSPKAFAGISDLEATLASRCIGITMIQSADPAFGEKEFNPESSGVGVTRDLLYLSALTFHQQIKDNTSTVDTMGLNNRSLEIWRPILAIAHTIDPTLASDLLAFATSHEAEKEDLFADPTTTEILTALEAHISSKEQRQDPFLPFHLIARILSEHDHDRFQWLTQSTSRLEAHRWLSTQLRQAGITTGASTTSRESGGTPVRGYRIDLNRVRERLVVYRKSVTSVTPVTEEGKLPETVTDVTKVTSEQESLFNTAQEVFNLS